MFEMRTIIISSLLPHIALSCSVGPCAERSVRLRVRATHSSWIPPSASTAGMYANCAGAGTSKKAADNACACAGDEGLVDCGGVKDGGGSRVPSPTASANADERFCHRSRRVRAEQGPEHESTYEWTIMLAWSWRPGTRAFAHGAKRGQAQVDFHCSYTLS
jgi:hypothetical protein